MVQASCGVQVQHDVLWVWPDSGANANLECLSRQPVDEHAWFNKNHAFVLHPWYVSMSGAHVNCVSFFVWLPCLCINLRVTHAHIAHTPCCLTVCCVLKKTVH